MNCSTCMVLGLGGVWWRRAPAVRGAKQDELFAGTTLRMKVREDLPGGLLSKGTTGRG